jgi:hypothetical protein
MFRKEITDFGSALAVHHFSVAKSDEELGLAHRAMVKYEGSDSWDGIWKCSKDGASCAHISAARRSMRGLRMEGEEDEEDEHQAPRVIDICGDSSICINPLLLTYFQRTRGAITTTEQYHICLYLRLYGLCSVMKAIAIQESLLSERLLISSGLIRIPVVIVEMEEVHPMIQIFPRSCAKRPSTLLWRHIQWILNCKSARDALQPVGST